MRLSRRLGVTLAALFLTLGIGLAPGRVPANGVTLIKLSTGHSIVLDVPGLSRVAIGDSSVAGAVPIGTSELVINAKGPGHTTIITWIGSRRVYYEVTVTQSGADDLAQIYRAALPYPNVQVMSFGKTILFRGTVDNMQQFADLQDLISRFNGAILPGNKGGGDDKIILINAVTVEHSLGSIQNEFKNTPGVSELQIEPDTKGNIIVSGRVHDSAQAEQVIARATTLAEYLAIDGKVIDRLQVTASSQIDIKVYVLEVDKTALNDLGVSLQSATPNDIVNPTQYSLGGASFPIVEGSAAAGLGRALNVGPFFRTTYLAPTLNLIIQSGDARILSAPDLVTMPGVQASFLVGGQIPYVYSTGLGQVSIEFKNYGVQLKVTPTITPDGSVDAQITPDISNLDYTDAVEIGGFFIPALKEDTLTTELIAKPGQSVIMGGMLERIQQRTIEKIPILSQIPILGKLFQDTRYQDQQTDVVFVLTPEVITQ